MNNEEMRARVQVFLMKEKIKDLKRKQRDMELRYAIREAHEHQRELEERYNHYHDPHNGRFASGAGGGEGLYYSMGKGKGAIVGSYSDVASKTTFVPSPLTKGGISSKIEDGKHGDFTDKVNELKKSGIEYKEVTELKQPLSEEKIIDKLGGGDQTKGSCVSLAYAYAANKAGYDVTDYRGGDSQDWFATGNRGRINQLPDTLEVKFGRDATPGKVMKFLSDNIGDGEEYVVSAGKHCTVVKKENGKLRYLELQQEPGARYKSGIGVKGWKPMTKASTFSDRFAYSKKYGFYSGASIIKVSDLPKAVGFKEMVGYLNTAPDRQQKGVKGYAK